MKFFDKLQVATTKRSVENLDSFHVTTTDFGRLDVPYVNEVVEGEDIEFQMKSYFDAACMVVPTRGRVFLNVRAFFVPNRILCDKNYFDWNLWRTGLTSNAHPYILESELETLYNGSGSGTLTDAAECKDLRRLYSQLGLPSRIYNTLSSNIHYENIERISPFPFFAYNRIWWDWYRDSNLIDDSQFSNYCGLCRSGEVHINTWFRPRYACYGKDYFTTAKLNPQEGVVSAGTRAEISDQSIAAPSNPNNSLNYYGTIIDPTVNSYYNVSVQFLRAANALQRILERNNIAGGRVMARFLARFGQAPDSVRLDQSEYLGGNSYIMSIGGITSPLQAGDAGSPVNPFIDDTVSMAGQRVGRGVIEGTTPVIRYHAKEHGVFMVIATLIPEVGYYQGLHKMWTRGVKNVREDYLTPECECLGYEPIYGKELAMQDSEEDTGNNSLWGFSRRYGSYCYKNNIVSGDMVLSETRTGMEAFHLLRDFRGSDGYIDQPALNANFTMIATAARKQFDRIFQIIGNAGDYDHFEGYHECRCRAVLPKSPNAMPSLEEDSHSSGKHIQIDNGGTRF